MDIFVNSLFPLKSQKKKKKKLQISSFKKHFSTLGGEKNSFTKSLNAWETNFAKEL